jgi:hypothetical protein
MNRVEDGDEYLQPLNMAPLGTDTSASSQEDTTSSSKTGGNDDV